MGVRDARDNKQLPSVRVNVGFRTSPGHRQFTRVHLLKFPKDFFLPKDFHHLSSLLGQHDVNALARSSHTLPDKILILVYFEGITAASPLSSYSIIPGEYDFDVYTATCSIDGLEMRIVSREQSEEPFILTHTTL